MSAAGEDDWAQRKLLGGGAGQPGLLETARAFSHSPVAWLWLLSCLVLSIVAPFLLLLASILTSSSTLPGPSLCFSPPSVAHQCLCSAMYTWSKPLTRVSGLPDRLDWRLSPSRSYAEWDACPMWVPRTALLHSAPPLPGPAVDAQQPLNDSIADLVWQLPPCLLSDVWLTDSRTNATCDTRPPLFSLQLTVFNQEAHVLDNLHALLRHADVEQPFELVVVFDDCTDRSIPLVHALLHSVKLGCAGVRGHLGDGGVEEELPAMSWKDVTLPPELNSSLSCINPALVHIRTIVQPTSVWETTANNIGARAAFADAQWLVFIQDDVIMSMDGWNAVLVLPARLYTDVIAVSARCTHTRYTAASEPHRPWGRCGRDVGEPLVSQPEERCTFWVRDTANRGPLLVVHEYMKALGYFDEVHFHMDDSDHDLFARAYNETGRVVGFFGVDFVAPLDHGGQRRPFPMPKPNSSIAYLAARQQRKGLTPAQLGLIIDGPGRQWASHDDDRPLLGHLYQHCVEHFRSEREQHKRWWRDIPP